MSFTKLYHLIRHERTVCLDSVSAPSPKRPKKEEESTPRHPLVSEEPIDPLDRLPFLYALSTDLLNVVREHWSAVSTRLRRCLLQTRFNFRLTTLDTTDLEEPLKSMFEEQTHAFKVNLSYGFVMRNNNTGRYRYYYSSCNCCGRYLDEPTLATNRSDFDVLQWAINQRPDSAWVCELVTNVTFFINCVIHHPIGCVGVVSFPIYVKKNRQRPRKRALQ